MKTLRYLRYVLVHKWHVLRAGLGLGVPLWRLILHDWTKFLPCEFIPYRDWFYSNWRQDNYQGESAAPEALKTAFDYAWNHHCHKNDHHWQFFILKYDDPGMKILEMTDVARREMLADWIGAGRALGKPDTRGWYLYNRETIFLAPLTRAWIEGQLQI